MKKLITLLITLFSVSFMSAQSEGTYYILHPQKDRNTGKVLETMYVQIKESEQQGKIAVLSTHKGGYGISMKLDKDSTKKAKKEVYSYTRSFFIAYDENSCVSFLIVGKTNEGKLKITKPNFYSKDKSKLKNMNDEIIENYVQKINALLE